MILRRPHLCWRCLTIALGLLVGFLTLAHADSDASNEQPKFADVSPANAGVPDDLPDFNEPGAQVVASAPILKDQMNVQPAPTDISKDTGIFLYGDPKPAKPAQQAN